MSNAKKNETKAADTVVETAVVETALEVHKVSHPAKGTPEAGELMESIRSARTPESFQKAGETKQKTAAFKNALQKATSMQISGVPLGDFAVSVWDKFRHNGLESHMDAMAIAMVVRAENGDVDAAKFVRDTMGEKPVEETNHGGNFTITIAPQLEDYAG